MIFTAIVVDNSTFLTDGEILVNIPDFSGSTFVWDFSEAADEIKRAYDLDGNFKGFRARLTGSIGGGKNYGELIIPQINQKGLVAAIRNSLSEFYWLGSFFEVINDKDGKKLGTTAPSSLEEDEGTDIIFQNSDLSRTNYILRTKNTDFLDDSGKNLNWNTSPTTNIVEIGAQNYSVKHFGSLLQNFLMDADKNSYIETTSKASLLMDSSNEINISSEFKQEGTPAEKAGDEYANLYRDIGSIDISYNGNKIEHIVYKEKYITVDSVFQMDAAKTSLVKTFYKDGAEDIAFVSTITQDTSQTTISFEDIVNKVVSKIMESADGFNINFTDKNGKSFIINLSSDGVTIDAGEKDVVVTAKNFKMKAENVIYGDSGEWYVLSTVLKDILDALFSHGHITNTGATQGPAMVSGSNPTPLSGSMASKVMKMSSKK